MEEEWGKEEWDEEEEWVGEEEWEEEEEEWVEEEWEEKEEWEEEEEKEWEEDGEWVEEEKWEEEEYEMEEEWGKEEWDEEEWVGEEEWEEEEEEWVEEEWEEKEEWEEEEEKEWEEDEEWVEEEEWEVAEEIMSSSQRGTPVSGEITRIVRHYYHPPPTEPYATQKIWCRSNRQLSSERPDDLWHNHFVRRHENLHRGFHSVPWEPYSPVGGEIILDPCELILTTLSDQLDHKIWSYYHPVRRTDRRQSCDKSRQERVKSSNSSAALDRDNYPTAGYNHTREHIKDSLQRLKAVKAGQPYEENIKKKQNMQRLEEEERNKPETDMVLKSVSNFSYLAAVRNVYDQAEESETVCEDSSRDQLTEESASFSSPLFSRMSMTRPSSGTELRPGSSEKKLYRISSGIAEKRDRQRKSHLNFLEAIYLLLSSLNNLKTKDLKTKNPLPLDVMMAIRLEWQAPTNYNPDRESRNRQSRQLRVSTESMHPSDTPPPGAQQWDRMSVFMPSYRRLTSIELPSSRLRERRKSRVEQPSDRSRLETWEDLMAIEDKPQSTSGEPSPNGFNISVGIVTKAIKWQKRASVMMTPRINSMSAASTLDGVKEGEGRENNKPPSTIPPMPPLLREPPPPRKPPIWQLVAQEKSTKVFSDRQRSRATDLGKIVQKSRRDFNKLKQTLEQENDSELQKLQREKMVLFRMKFNMFENMSPLFQENKFYMQQASASLNRNAEALDVQPARWFEELREKTCNICCPCDIRMMEILNKINKFSLMDNKTVPHAKAKLCLLVMSLPAYEICQVWMQLAVEYVLEVILLGDNDQFKGWLESRKLPYIVYTS
ncbi:hypothetical protein ScPMuIL_009759 [Solemya velum]